MNHTKEIISQWVSDYTGELYRYALFKTSDRELSKDIVQETFLAACKNLHSFQNKSNPKTWLFSILKHKIADEQRRLFKQRESQELSEDLVFFNEYGRWKKEMAPAEWLEAKDNLLEDTEFTKVLNDCIKKLPSQWIFVVYSKYFDNKSTAEIGEESETSTANIWQILHRVKLQLRQCLQLNLFNR